MKRLFLLIHLLAVMVVAHGMDAERFAELQARVSGLSQQKDAEAVFALEKEYDAFYADRANQTPETKFNYALVKLHVAYRHIGQHNYPSAERSLLQMIELSQNFTKLLAHAYSALSQCYSYWALEKELYNNYADAIQYSLLTISYANMAQKEERVISQYIKLGYEYTQINDFDNAHKSLQEAENRAARIEGGDKFSADIAYRRAELESKQHNYKDAIALFETAYTLYEQSDVSNKQEHLITTAHSLSNLYRFQLHNEEKGAYWEDIATSHQRRKTDSEDSFTKILQDMVAILQIQNAGQHEEAIRRYRAVIQSLSADQSYEHQAMVAKCYYGCATSNMRLRAYEAAIADLEQAITYNQSAGQKEALIECYTMLSYVYHYTHQYAESVTAAGEAVRIAESFYDADSKDLGECYTNLANMYAFHGDFDNSKKYLMKAVAIHEQDVKQIFSYLTSQERNSYWASVQRDILLSQPFLLKMNERQSVYTDALYDVQLLSKGLLLQSDIELQMLSLRSPRLQSLFAEIVRIKRAMMQEDLPRDSVRVLKQQAEKLERDLTVSSSEVGNFLHFLDITQADVKQGLAPNSMAIEFATFRYGKDSLMTVAYMMRKNWEHVLMLPLYEERDIKPLLNTSTESKTNHTYDFDGHGEQLAQHIWSKILPFVKPGETIYFAPSGLLHQLAIENLPYDETRTMADVYQLVRLSSTREMVTKSTDSQHASATLYGGILYDVDTDVLLAESERYPDVARNRGIEEDTINRGTIKYLKGTKTEVENIDAMLRQNKVQVQLYTSKSANEESFKALSGKHQHILHIATHGFFWTDSTAQKKDYFSQRSAEGNGAIDPLNRCGLLFAGAQTAWSGHSADLPQGVQDGILTAKEISLLDLRDANLVVLSACETGKGEVTGDGVFGLQRAFKQAGAQTIIMSLWPVNDAATQLLMTEFYKNWITQQQPKREAFRNAQNTVRAQYEEPVYWAGFIMLD
ncbi:MAG: CHAT domain-containing protein [Paludibacteraceae bacterium]|nr:CHAT domain-containing protein [Paludibacteraceae bacterium]